MAVTLSCVLPAFNEAENIEMSVFRAREAMDRLLRQGALDDWEIIVVDDGSFDGTSRKVESIGDRRVRLLRHDRNRGYGATLKTGFNAACMSHVFFTDADLQFDAREIDRLLPWIVHYDIVAGYRSPRQDPWMRRANAAAWGMALHKAFGLEVEDVNCAFKLFRRRVLDGLHIDSQGAFVNAEILLKARCAGFTIKQVPVSHFARQTGSQTGADPKVVFRAFREMARFYRHQKSAQAAVSVWAK